MDIHKDPYQAQARKTVLRVFFTVTKNLSNGPLFRLLSVLFMLLELELT